MPDLIPAEILAECIVPPPMPVRYYLYGWNQRRLRWQLCGGQWPAGYDTLTNALDAAKCYSQANYPIIRVVRIGMVDAKAGFGQVPLTNAIADNELSASTARKQLGT